MVSAHDAVDEFLWLPSGGEMIFTAQGSGRYDDGLYYWDLRTNHLRNLLPDFRKKHFESLPEETRLLIGLSHVRTKPEQFYVFAAAMPPQGDLDPKLFYRYQSFFAFDPKNDFISTRVAAEGDEVSSIFDHEVSHLALLDPAESNLATPSQKAWTELPIQGDKQSLLESWQSYCSTYANSASLPYALWWLASIYNDTYRALRTSDPQNARTVRNFALEIADALSQLPSSPLYLRGFAEHLKKNLLLSRPAAYNVTPEIADAKPGRTDP
jgi:hypothetical protein